MTLDASLVDAAHDAHSVKRCADSTLRQHPPFPLFSGHPSLYDSTNSGNNARSVAPSDTRGKSRSRTISNSGVGVRCSVV